MARSIYRDESANSSWQLAAITVEASDLAPEQDFPLELRLGGIFGTNTINYAVKGTGKLDFEAGRIDGNSLDFRGVADHYTQAALFWNSQTDVEKQHIINAFRFELSRVQTPAVRERMVSGLMNVNAELAKAVAAGLGLREMPTPMPKALTRDVTPEVSASSALSLFAPTWRWQHPHSTNRDFGRGWVRWRGLGRACRLVDHGRRSAAIRLLHARIGRADVG